MSADLVIFNANVRTLNSSQPAAQAIAIIENKIVKVGSGQQVQQLIDEKTKVINLNGKTVIPGLIDTHIHVADFGRCLMWLELKNAKSIGQLQNMLKEKDQNMQRGQWIIGQGWNENRLKRLPTTADLDEAVPDNPVILYREAAMICVANSKAQELAGITEQIPVPSGGSIDKDPKTGKPTGIFRDTATSLIWQAVPEPSQEELLENTALACQKISQAGLTSVHWIVLSENELPIIQKLYEQKRLPFRVNVIVPFELMGKMGNFEPFDQLELRLSSVTVNVDGYLDSKEAALFEPYSDDQKNSGKTLCSEDMLSDSVGKMVAAGLQPCIVAMGDRAVDLALTVIENLPNRVRFRIEQAAVLNEGLVQRLKQQQVVVSVQPKVISTEFSVWSAVEHLGLKRAKWLHPLKTLIIAGVKVVGGSDCPMEPLNPLLGIQEVVLRQVFPEQRLSVEEALKMYTLYAAFSSSEEAIKGSIEEGKLADLTVLSNDITEVALDKIKDIKVEHVVVNGVLLY